MKTLGLIVGVAITLCACNKVNLNPFGKDAEASVTSNQVVVCEDKKTFAIRWENQKSNVWVLLTDHEVYLTQEEDAANRYSNGNYVLTFGDESISLSNENAINYRQCQFGNK